MAHPEVGHQLLQKALAHFGDGVDMDREPRFERLPTLAEVEGYISLLGQVEDHLNRKKPASTALA